MTFRAPAKINLFLRIRGKRPDGFHELETLMAPLSLADTLSISLSPEPGLHFTCSDATLPTGDDNLVLRAARAFYEAAGRPPAATIHLEKAIPHGAGLGGGSSDAATTLLALNGLFNEPLPHDELHRIAASIGSDIPFFLAQSAALCRGRGEIVTPVPSPGRLPLLLIKPGFGVPTPWAYQNWQGSRPLPGIDYEPQPFPWGELVNDLERPVFAKYLLLPVIKRWLLAQPETAGALMSGSGATCFALLRDPSEGPALEARARQEFGKVWTCLCHTF